MMYNGSFNAHSVCYSKHGNVAFDVFFLLLEITIAIKLLLFLYSLHETCSQLITSTGKECLMYSNM
jgi:hypothetical protein